MSKNDHITTDDVAKAAGVSRYTVSRVLNNRGGVTQKTIDLIRRTIRDLGYIPSADESRRGPKPKPENPERSSLVLFAAFGLEDSVLRTGFYHDLSLSVEQELSRQGCGMVTQRFLPGSKLPLNLSSVDGAVFLGVPPPDIKEQTKPVVQALGETLDRELWDHVTYDGYRIGVLAAGYLLAKHHRHCALLCSDGARRRHAGFIDTLHASGQDPLVLSGEKSLYCKTETIHEIDFNQLNSQVDRMLAVTPRPTGLFVDADMITVALYSSLYARGLIPGKDLDIISCNNEHALLAPLIPRPPSIDLHVRWIGQAAVDRLLQRIDHPMEPVAQIVCQPSLASLT